MGFVFAVAAVIVRGEKVLAMRRSPQRDAGAGLWETVSGRVHVDEDPLVAVEREIREETGLTVQIDPRPMDAYTARRAGAPMVVVVYRATYSTGEVARSDEHDAHEWLIPDAFRARSSLTRLADAIDRAFTTPGTAASSDPGRGGAGGPGSADPDPRAP